MDFYYFLLLIHVFCQIQFINDNRVSQGEGNEDRALPEADEDETTEPDQGTDADEDETTELDQDNGGPIFFSKMYCPHRYQSAMCKCNLFPCVYSDHDGDDHNGDDHDVDHDHDDETHREHPQHDEL